MTRPPGGVRPARASDLPLLQAIERAAGSLFAPLGMDLVAEDDPPTIAALTEYQREGRAWVRTDQGGPPGRLPDIVILRMTPRPRAVPLLRGAVSSCLRGPLRGPLGTTGPGFA
jgi:hypothetical protein